MGHAFAAASFAALLVLANLASAHAILIGSQPKEAGEVVGPDVDVSLEFNSRIDAARSSLRLAREDAGTPQLAPVSAGVQVLALAESAEPNKLVARASGLAPGEYHLRWQVLSVDGHVSRGSVNFRVRAP
ncbi:MAG TPA: copper resistance CopC family protein [Myxococcota bacterium]|nr:copper resistance CopC family protein [Myxococcota bacterium]